MEQKTIEKEFLVDFIKVEEEKRLVTGIVAEPDVEDTYGDVISAEEIEKAMVRFMELGPEIRVEHDPSFIPKVAIIENWIEREGRMIGNIFVKAGTWLMTTKVIDNEVWELIKDGRLNGYSFRGPGIGVMAQEVMQFVRYQIIDLDIREVSFVDKPANRRKYIFIKDRGGETNMDPIKLESLSYEDRRKLETEVEAKLLPDLKKKFDETYKAEFEKTFTDEKIETLKAELRPAIESDLREEFGKQDKGVSKESAVKITTALKDIIRGATEMSKLVGYGYKVANAEDEKIREELEKSIEELKATMLTEKGLKELVENK